MRLKDADWLSQAEALTPGASIKVPHQGCSTSACMKLSHGLEGFQGYCFKCNAVGFKRHDRSSVTDYLDRKAALQAEDEAKQLRGYAKPVDFSRSLPVPASVWLAMNGLRPSLWEQLDIGWSEKLQRIILPVWYKGQYLGFTARGLYKNQAKYIERMPQGAVGLFNMHCNGTVGNQLVTDYTECVVFTEDWMSAAVVSQVAPAIPLLGTASSTAVLAAALEFKRVFIWLDPDAAGIKGRSELLRNLRPLLPCKVVQSARDPKFYSAAEIKVKLEV